MHRLNQNPADQLSWSEFVRFYGPAIRGWLQHWGLQEADAQDVTQAVLLKLFEKMRGGAIGDALTAILDPVAFARVHRRRNTAGDGRTRPGCRVVRRDVPASRC